MMRNRDEEQLFSTQNVSTRKSYTIATLHLRLILVKHCQVEAIEGVWMWPEDQAIPSLEELCGLLPVRGSVTQMPFWDTV